MNPATGTELTFRDAGAADLPAIFALLEAARLPTREVEANIDGFVVAEHAGVILACGAIELHEDTGVLRSVAVAAASRGGGVGRRLCETLIDDGRAAGVRDFYLFTRHAWPFWHKLGFSDVGLEDWREPARASRQYMHVAGRPKKSRRRMEPHSMWRPG